MEIKDLVLLLAIPALLIGMLFSIGKMTITGAATAEEANQKLGEYSIMPSFKAKIDYDIQGEYSKLKASLKQIIDECKLQPNMEECISKKTNEDKKIQWKCEERDTDALYDFVDKLRDCIRLQDTFVCQFSFERREYINKVKAQRTFEIRLTNWYAPRVKIELFEDGKWLGMEYADMEKLTYADSKANPPKNANSIIIKVLFDEGNPIIQEAYASTDESPRVELSKLLLLYKSLGTHFIDKGVEGNFRIPPNKIVNLPNIKGMKFCAKTGKQVLAYDNSDGTVKIRDIEYKFAITFPKPVPKPLEGLSAFDALKAENGIILNWSKPKQDGITSYVIYYSENPFSDKKISYIKQDSNIIKISAEAAEPIRIDNIDVTKCEDIPCGYLGYKNPLIAGKLYYAKLSNKFIYLIKDANLIDEKQYNFAVTAVNSQGEISNDKSVLGNTEILSDDRNYIKATPLDDLAPGKVSSLSKSKTDGKTKITWKRPLQNIDGSDAKDVFGYRIYYKQSLSDINPQLEPDHQIRQVTNTEAKCDIIPLVCEYPLENIALEKGQYYNFAVIPIDEKGNEYNLESDRISVRIE